MSLLTFLFFSTYISAQTLAQFQLEGNFNPSINNTVGTPSITANSMTFDTSGTECQGNNKITANDNGDYIDIFINTTDFQDIEISWQSNRITNNSGNNDWNLFGDYNNDNAVDNTYNTGTVDASCTTFSQALPSSYDNQSNVRLRIQRAGAGSDVNSIDDINITGTQVCLNPINPSPSCNALRVIVVLDESGSISASTATQVEDATLALANALKGTGAQMAIVEFSSDSEIGTYGGYTNYNLVNQAYYDALNHPTTGLRPSYGDGGWTNWEAALNDVLTLNDIAVADIVLFMTDGNPTAYVRDSDNAILTNQNGTVSLNNALDEACEIKQDGSHFFMLGVGSGISASNLQAVSGPIQDDGPGNPTLTVLSADYGLITAGDLTACFLDIAQSGCNNDLSLDKRVYSGHNGGSGCLTSLKTIPNPNDSKVTYCFTITNAGQQTISNLTFNDPTLGINQASLTPAWVTSLTTGASVTYYYETTLPGNTVFPYVNIANVAGQTPVGDPLSDSSDAEVTEPLCVAPTLSTTNGEVCGEGQSSIDLSTLVTTNGAVITYHASQADADNDVNPIGSTVSPLVATPYYVRSEATEGCYSTATITISVNPLPTVTLSAAGPY
ncbi:MAG: VWA domain-containing protein, partial [Gelidibacter sp.]|nr:VWA domain-containing protein [Gelidibacter sp.]